MNLAMSLSEKLLTSAFQAQASDIHFYPFEKNTKIFLRVHGKRILHESMPLDQYQLLKTYLKFNSGMDIGETRKPQNGTIEIKQNEALYYLRLSTLPIHQSESMAIRILPQNENLTLDELFLFPNQLEHIKKWMSHKSGLILVTGPTGSGKTTTLYALLEALLKEKSYQTITLEDPIEKEIPNILQVQVNEKAGITYQTGLKAALRHDPDIIMVGEIRDEATAKFAFEASLTGHLVLSTLHAKNAQGTIHRLLDMGIPEIEIKQSLIAVAAVELVPISMPSIPSRRAAILELLDGEYLEQIWLMNQKRTIASFKHLRKKAYAYGFINEETLISP